MHERLQGLLSTQAIDVQPRLSFLTTRHSIFSSRARVTCHQPLQDKSAMLHPAVLFDFALTCEALSPRPAIIRFVAYQPPAAVPTCGVQHPACSACKAQAAQQHASCWHD